MGLTEDIPFSKSGHGFVRASWGVDKGYEELRATIALLETRVAELDEEAATARDLEKRLEHVRDATTDGVWEWNIETGEISWSGRAHYPRDVRDAEAGVITLTNSALARAWCPDEQWREPGRRSPAKCEE